jgi:hypothetical protein
MRIKLRHDGVVAPLVGVRPRAAKEADMNPDRLHKQWADRYLLIWLVFALTLLSGFEFVLEHAGIDAAGRAGIVALLAFLVLLAAIWQAVGLAVARVHMIIAGIDLER